MLERTEQARPACRTGAVVMVTGTVQTEERFGDQLVIAVDPDRRAPTNTTSTICSTVPARSAELLEQDPARADRHGPAPAPAPSARRAGRAPARRSGSGSATRRPPSTTTRPIATACSSTASPSPQAVSAISATFPDVDRDIAVTGAILHDIGKLDAYEQTGAVIDMSDSGRLFGEIPPRLLPDPAPRSSSSAGFRPTTSGRCCTSSSATTARSSTAARSSRRRARRRWSTASTPLGARLGSFDRVQKGLTRPDNAGRALTRASAGARTSARCCSPPHKPGRSPRGAVLRHPSAGASRSTAVKSAQIARRKRSHSRSAAGPPRLR